MGLADYTIDYNPHDKIYSVRDVFLFSEHYRYSSRDNPVALFVLWRQPNNIYDYRFHDSTERGYEFALTLRKN